MHMTSILALRLPLLIALSALALAGCPDIPVPVDPDDDDDGWDDIPGPGAENHAPEFTSAPPSMKE